MLAARHVYSVRSRKLRRQRGALLQRGALRCVQAHVCSVPTTPTWLGTPELRPDARTRYTNLFTGRYHFTFVSAA